MINGDDIKQNIRMWKASKYNDTSVRLVKFGCQNKGKQACIVTMRHLRQQMSRSAAQTSNPGPYQARTYPSGTRANSETCRYPDEQGSRGCRLRAQTPSRRAGLRT